MRFLFIISILLYSGVAFCRTVIFDGNPVDVYLFPDTDTVIRFDEPQRVGLPNSLAGHIAVRPAGNFVSLTLSEEAEGEVIFQGLNSGSVVYIRVHVASGVGQADSEIVVRRTGGVSSSTSEASNQEREDRLESTLQPRERVEALVRGIAQRFGPVHAIEDMPFPLIDVGRQYEAEPIQGLYRHPKVIMQPLRTYTGGGVYGTVFIFNNMGDSGITFDPSLLRGKWIALDVRSEDAVVRAKSKILVTLVHTRPLPNNLINLVIGRELL